jgi:hypothetical protein
MTSPLEREILTHYYTTPLPYTTRSLVHVEAVAKFVELGLLISDEDGVRADYEALGPYMDALAAVPLPVRRWVIP